MCIVKSIIDEEDIDLSINSELGKGSCFSYTFHTSMITQSISQSDELHLYKQE